MLSINHVGEDNINSKIALQIFEANKKGEKVSEKEPTEKKTQQLSWNVDNLARILRELYSSFTWEKVFEGLAYIKEELVIDQKGFNFFLTLFNKVKPQNLSFPLGIILNMEWQSPLLQIQFLEHSVNLFIEKKDKSLGYGTLLDRQEIIEEFTGMKEKQIEII